MKNKRVRRLVGLACLGLALLLATWSGPAAAAGARWLPFAAGASQPAAPSLAVLTAGPAAIELRAGLPGAWVEDVQAEAVLYSRLTGPGYGQASTAGLPALPVLRRDVEIPFGAAVTLELVSAQYADYTLGELGLSPLYPLQPPVVKLPGEKEKQPFVIDREFYANGGLYPAAPLALGQTYVVRGHRVQTVEVWPVAYDAAAGTVRLYGAVTFRLRLAGSDLARTQALAERYAAPDFESRLSATVLNYNQGRPARTFGPDTTLGYVIVVADAYYDALQPFVQLKESRNFDVTTVKTSEIPGGATTANIKAYLQDAYDTWPLPPSYVLLVGDTNTVPTWTGPEIGTSTDLYYGTMDGSGDWHPDVGRGRFPVRSPAQTTIMVDKYVLYSELTGQEPWIKKAAFPATCDNYTVAEATHNYVIDTHTAPDGFIGHFPNDPQPGGDKLYCVTYGATQADVIEAANNGRWAIIYSGHGSYDGWELLDQSAIPTLTNYGMFPFVASHACLSGDFGQTEVFGETWVLQPNKGALVSWGSSTYSYWDEDDWLERGMFDSLFSEPYGHARVTEMTDYGLAQVELHSAGMAQYYWETYNVLGDPSVKLFLEPDLPTFTLDVDPLEHEVCESGSVSSTVTIGSLMGYAETVYLDTGTLPDGVTAGFNPESAQAPFSAVLTLEVAPGTPAGEYTIDLIATDNVSYTQASALTLQVREGEPETPVLLSPADGAVDQPFVPTFTWSALPDAGTYRFQLDRSPLFEEPIEDVSGLVDAEHTAASPLAGGLCYWWRAGGDNACGQGPWADPFHFATVALTTGFYDDMESGAGQWTHAAAQGVDHWALSTTQAHSPTHAWFVPDDGATTDTRLWNTTPVPVGAGSTLTFWHRYNFEGTSFDGSVLEISTNGGTTWTDLGSHITANGYNGTISTGYSNPLGGREGWTGDLTDWTMVEVDLSSFAGEQVHIRWRLGCDSSVSDTGWYIDDVQMTAPLPPNPAPELDSITPATGSPYAPVTVTIEGSNLLEQPSLRLGETWLTSVTLIGSTTIEAVVPAGMAPGVYDLVLYNGDCQKAVLEDAFSVVGQTFYVYLPLVVK